MKDGQPVHLAGIAVGDPAAVAVREPKDCGSGEATVVNASFGQKAVAEAKPKSKSPGKSGSKSGKGHAKGGKAEKAAKAVKETESAAPAKAADVPAVVPGVTPLPVVPPAQ